MLKLLLRNRIEIPSSSIFVITSILSLIGLILMLSSIIANPNSQPANGYYALTKKLGSHGNGDGQFHLPYDVARRLVTKCICG